MSLERKAGQLFQSWILSRASSEQKNKMKAWIRDVGLGGVILSLGTTEQARALIDELQACAKEAGLPPLLVTGDFECGVAFRLEGATPLGNQMLLGAGGLPRLAEAAGVLTAVEGRRLGFHWAFAPVVDVNVNPANPIINVRSFGEDPRLVARMSAAFVHGLESTGWMIGTAKHFPGHGDVASDSHLTMPTVPGDRKRLDEVDLVPFRAAIEAGVSSVMTGHLAVPGLGEEPLVPATLSQRILTGVLREELGFKGLIVTDALDMHGVREKIEPQEAAVRALAAGADVLLMPPDPLAARDAVVAAVKEGRVAQGRLDEACRRVLALKARLGVAGRLPALPQAERVLGRAGELAGEIARRGITLVKDEQGLWPLRTKPSVLVGLLDEAPAAGRGEALPAARRYLVHRQSTADEIAAAAKALRESELPFVALYVKVRSYSGTIGLPAELAPVVEALRAKPRAVVVSFGNPYLVARFPGVSTYACAYDGSPHVEAAVAQALLGKTPVTGRLPITIPAVAERGSGLSRLPSGGALEPALPAEEGLRATLPAEVRTLLERAVADRCAPGAVCLVLRRGRVVTEVAVGREGYDAGSPAVTPQTRYDLASLTKVCATTPLVLKLVEQGKLSLEGKVAELVPGFTGTGKEKVTLRHLLTHSAGLPAYERFYQTLAGKEAILEAASKAPLMGEPGGATVYSDLGMILLLACAERAGGKDFATLCKEQVFAPLQMRTATFGAVGKPLDAPPTEDDPWRGRVVRGEVHDENAFAMGGVSGHAGLFGTAEDVARIGCAFLGGGGGWLDPRLATGATMRQGLVEGSPRALGFDTHERGFWHTGFTGTSLWCDRQRDLCVVLLTNRVHPTRVNAKIMKLRKDLHELVSGACED
jgi:beta-glucosidase-like glycosyl hydrolase/CubicO group peptidase (beta-lactamase class C family)